MVFASKLLVVGLAVSVQFVISVIVVVCIVILVSVVIGGALVVVGGPARMPGWEESSVCWTFW